jgi:daunorubicin resistance ABC transporter ATP-binding subunit
MSSTVPILDRGPQPEQEPAASLPTDPSTAAVVFTSVHKSYGSVAALRGMDLVVPRGEIFGLLGPNGSGKTTTVNLLCGLIAPTSGEVTVLGRNVTHDPKSLRPLLGVVPQETALYGELSAERNLRFHAELYGIPRRERAARIREMLELVDLWERRTNPVKTFSGGMKRRLAIARAMLHRPSILYLDEPTLGVDVPSRRAVWAYLRDLRAQGTTILLTTNYLEEASELCDRIVIVDRGRAVGAGTPDELRARIGGSVLEMTLAEPPAASLRQELLALDGVVSVDGDRQQLSVTYAAGDETAARIINTLAATGSLQRFAQRHASLDEVFLQLTGSDDEH